jgi:hypothetical protein
MLLFDNSLNVQSLVCLPYLYEKDMSHSGVPHSGVRIHMELLEQEPQADPQWIQHRYAKVNYHPPAYHPLDARYDSVVDEPQLI